MQTCRFVFACFCLASECCLCAGAGLLLLLVHKQSCDSSVNVCCCMCAGTSVLFGNTRGVVYAVVETAVAAVTNLSGLLVRRCLRAVTGAVVHAAVRAACAATLR
jgi:hypothetical protein